MSGGAYNYFYLKVGEWPVDKNLMDMLAAIFREVEWAESADTSPQDAAKRCYEAVKVYLDKKVLHA